MRIDRLLCNIRLVRTRTLAARLVSGGLLRRNGIRVLRPSQDIAVGDVLTVPIGASVRVIEVLSLPERRGGAALAAACYRVLDPPMQCAIGPDQHTEPEGVRRP